MIIVLAIAIVILACSSIAFCVAFSKLWDKFVEMKTDYQYFSKLIEINNQSLQCMRIELNKQYEVYKKMLEIDNIQTSQYQLLNEKVNIMQDLCSKISEQHRDLLKSLNEFYKQQYGLDDKYDHIYDMFGRCQDLLKKLNEKYDYICSRVGDEHEASETPLPEMAGVERTEHNEPDNESADPPPSGA